LPHSRRCSQPMRRRVTAKFFLSAPWSLTLIIEQIVVVMCNNVTRDIFLSFKIFVKTSRIFLILFKFLYSFLIFDVPSWFLMLRLIRSLLLCLQILLVQRMVKIWSFFFLIFFIFNVFYLWSLSYNKWLLRLNYLLVIYSNLWLSSHHILFRSYLSYLTILSIIRHNKSSLNCSYLFPLLSYLYEVPH